MRRIALALALLILVPTVPVTAASAAPVIQTSSQRYDLWYREDFDKGDSTWGNWDKGPYTRRLSVYDGFSERNVGPVVYDKSTVTVHDGVLDLWGYKRPLADGSWQPVGAGVVPLLGGKYTGFMYGRYEFSIGMFPQGSDGMAGWWFAGLLWPQSNLHKDGEIDWPEGVPGQQAIGFHHNLGVNGVNPQSTCYSFTDPTWTLAGWHTYAIDWKPSGFTYFRDGVKVGFSNCAMPKSAMLLKLQLVSLNQMPSANSFGHILIDSIRIYKFYWT